MTTIPITYVTSSKNKREELAIISDQCALSGGHIVKELFRIEVVENTIQETLEVSIDTLVRAEAKNAYRMLKRPCIVEHAGLVFEDLRDQTYPGGLTKPMWNALGVNFVKETRSSGRSTLAQAVVGYCDGEQVHTFTGTTAGKLASNPRGSREFYWDTVFIPTQQNEDNLTYAEIVDRDGLAAKVLNHSQSTKALICFLEWRRLNNPKLWQVSF